MPRLVEYQCPECHQTFEFLHHPVDEPPPDYCPKCNAYVGDGEAPLTKAPVLALNMGTYKGKVPDQVYRALEESSAARAEEAAALVGADKSEMSAIKVTNLKDNTRAGDVQAVMAPEAKGMAGLTNRITGAAPALHQVNEQQALAYRAEVAAGGDNGQVVNLRKTLNHRQMIAQKTQMGQMAKA